MSKPILDQRTFQTEDTSKTKCSICKKEGHNRRSCKKMTTPVSVPKIEAETDVKVIPSVEQEMSSESAHNMLIRIIQKYKEKEEKEEKQDIYKNK